MYLSSFFYSYTITIEISVPNVFTIIGLTLLQDKPPSPQPILVIPTEHIWLANNTSLKLYNPFSS